MQYSDLPSRLTLFVDFVYGEEKANAMCQAVHGRWRALPKEARPRLFVFGLNLGSLNSDLASDACAVGGAIRLQNLAASHRPSSRFAGLAATDPPFRSALKASTMNP